GVPITYRMKATGEVLFDKFTGDFGTATDKLLKLNFPDFYHGHMDQESVFQCTEAGRSGSTFYWGYFGPGSTGKVVQYDGDGGAHFASGGHGLYLQCDPQVSLNWTHLTPEGGQSVTGCGGGSEICLEGARFESGIER